MKTSIKLYCALVLLVLCTARLLRINSHHHRVETLAVSTGTTPILESAIPDKDVLLPTEVIILTPLTNLVKEMPLTNSEVASEDIEEVLPLPSSLILHKSEISLYVKTKRQLQTDFPVTLPKRSDSGSFEKNSSRLGQEAATSRDKWIAFANVAPVEKLRQANSILVNLTPAEKADFNPWYETYQNRRQMMAQGLSKSEINKIIGSKSYAPR